MKLEKQKVLAKGSYGITCLTKDVETGKLYTVKFFMMGKRRQYGHFNLRELDILSSHKHPNLNTAETILTTHPFEVLIPKNMILDKYCVVYPFADFDLNHFILLNEKNKFKKIIYQMLSGLYYLHLHDLVHRDIKPANILYFKSSDSIKITDFGLSKHLIKVESKNSNRIGTFNYMAPEILLKNENYDKSIDIWSCGCVILKMIKGTDFFDCEGDRKLDLFKIILKTFGHDEVDIENILDLEQLSSSHWLKLTKEEILEVGDVDNFYDLIDSMLMLNPADRSTVIECMTHPYFSDIEFKQKELKIIYHTYDLSERSDKFEGLNFFRNFIDSEQSEPIIAFLALDLFERFMLKDVMFDIKIIACCCLYIAHKYYKGQESLSPSQIMKMPIDVKQYEEVEISLLNSIDFKIYRHHVLDLVPTVLTIEQMIFMFKTLLSFKVMSGYSVINITKCLLEILNKQK